MTRDYVALAAQYQADVLAGTIPACKWVKLACARNRRDLDRQDKPDFPFHFDPTAGARICQFAELLPHVKVPYAEIVGEDDQGRAIWKTITLEPWQCWFLSTLFGWKRQDGTRRFRVGILLVPRKNSKSTMGAIIALYMFAMEARTGGEVYSAATTRDQAKIIAEIAWEMASRSPQFREQFGIRLGSRTTRRLTIPASGSKFEPLSADANSLDGLNILCAVVDELHAHKTRAVWDVIDTATGAQLEPLLLAITTAGVEIGGICHEKLGYLEKVLDGVVQDESFFGTNYTIDQGDDIRDPLVQRKANPNYGVSVQPDDLVRKVTEAQVTQAALNNVLTKHFDVWIRTESSWMGATLWQTCARPAWVNGPDWRAIRDRAIEHWRAYPCWIGIDLGEVRDYSACVLLFKLPGECYGLVPFIYIPEDAIALSPIAQLPGWVRQESAVVTPGSEADYGRIEEDLLAWHARLNVREIDFDRKSARLMIQDFRKKIEPKLGRDRTEQCVIDVPQDLATMDPAMKFCEKLVVGTRLEHDGNPLFASMISNIVVERNHKDEIYPRKAGGKDSANKIDGPVALFTALSRAMVTPQEPTYQVMVFGGRR